MAIVVSGPKAGGTAANENPPSPFLARKRFGTFDALRRISHANLREGKYENEGYSYIPDADLSIQGVSANLAWSHSLSVARELKVPIKVTFKWRDKDGAAHPGQTGVLEWTPSQS